MRDESGRRVADDSGPPMRDERVRRVEDESVGPGTAARCVDVLVVGAGPAGLAAAARLAAAGAGRVEVLEREAWAGGVPRHCAHGGFGTWSHPLTGPRYARLVAEAADRAGALIRTGVSVLDWAAAEPRWTGGRLPPPAGGAADVEADAGAVDPYAGTPRCADGPATAPATVGRAGSGPGHPGLLLTTVGPGGPETIEARAVVLATGARERPRTARLVPGTRPGGVYTTGELQRAVHLFGRHIGTRAVVAGAEDVSYAAAGTVRAAGAEVVALVTEEPRARTSRARVQAARLLHRIPLLTGTTVVELLGHGRLSGARVRHLDGRTAVLPCDTIVFTGDFVAENELARRGGITLDGGPHTSRPGVFATGAVRCPGQPAEAATRDGARVGGAVLKWLAVAEWPGPEQAAPAPR
jgi:thioredoxin reductase